MRSIVLVAVLGLCVARDFEDKIDRYLISCHSTDFQCFKKQYKSLRDHVLLGNEKLDIPFYEPYTFSHEDHTCITLSGFELSEICGIQLDPVNREFTWNIELPFKIQQVKYTNCKMTNDLVSRPHNREIREMGFKKRFTGSDLVSRLHNREIREMGHKRFTGSGQMKRFTGNATIQVTYPYELKKKKSEIYMILGDENLDVILDIPDYSNYNNDSHLEKELYEHSEWAYEVVHRVDAAQQFALPYTSQFKTVTAVLPMHRFFQLYPDEDYPDLEFKFKASELVFNSIKDK